MGLDDLFSLGCLLAYFVLCLCLFVYLFVCLFVSEKSIAIPDSLITTPKLTNCSRAVFISFLIEALFSSL